MLSQSFIGQLHDSINLVRGRPELSRREEDLDSFVILCLFSWGVLFFNDCFILVFVVMCFYCLILLEDALSPDVCD